MLVAAALMAALIAAESSSTPGDEGSWKGAETLNLVSLLPNPARCPGSATNLEGRFAGSGIDTAGGAFAVTASGCLDLQTLRVSDLEATDTYLRTASALLIAPDDFTLVLDEETCVATNARPAAFTVRGGTGRFEGAQGRGQFDFAISFPPCGALPSPAHIWFAGSLTGVGE